MLHTVLRRHLSTLASIIFTNFFPKCGHIMVAPYNLCLGSLYYFVSILSVPIPDPLHLCSDQIRSVTQSCLTLCDPMNHQASLSITNSQSSLRLTSIESVMPSSRLILCRPLLLLPPIPPSIRVFSNESTRRMEWPKYWSFSFSIIFPRRKFTILEFHSMHKKIGKSIHKITLKTPKLLTCG